MELTVFPSLCTSTQHPLINSYLWCLAFVLSLYSPCLNRLSLSFPSILCSSLTWPSFLSFSLIPPASPFNHPTFPALHGNSLFPFPVFYALLFLFSSISLPSPLSLVPSFLLPCHRFTFTLILFLSIPSPTSLLLSFPCCLSSPACTTVAASKAIKQWEFSTQQMRWMDGRMSGRGWGWAAHRLDVWRREDNLHLFHARNVTEHKTNL